MNSFPPANACDVPLLSRREALKRAALVLGVALSPSILSGVLRAQGAARSDATTKPRYLDPKQFDTAAAVAERILPKTDTPGATEVGVPAFLDLMFGEYLTEEEKHLLSGGLADVEKASMAKYQRGFAQLSAAEQDGLLKAVAQASQAKEKTFFHLIRELTVVGYFTSEAVGKHVLHYDPIPGRFDACVPIADVGNVNWTK